MEKIRRYWNTPSRSAYVFIAPSVILLLLFNVIPLVMAFGLSFFDVPITLNTASFIGFDNFIEAFHDARFLNSLKITAIFTGLEVPIQVLGALIVAAVISKNNLKNKFLRAVYFLPVICSATVIGIMWRMILHSNWFYYSSIAVYGIWENKFHEYTGTYYICCVFYFYLEKFWNISDYLCDCNPTGIAFAF